LTFIDLFVYVSQASVLLPVTAGLIYYQKLTAVFRLLFYFFLLCIGFEILAKATNMIYNNNMPGLHLFSITQFLAFSTVYYRYFRDKSVLRRLISVNAVVAFIIAMADALWINGILNSNTVSRSYTALSIMMYTLVYFYRLFQTDALQYDRYDPMLWFSIAVLVYFANNILYFMLRPKLLAYATDIEAISYYIYLSLNIIAHCLYAQSFRSFGKWKAES
jgi:hypothetical protein